MATAANLNDDLPLPAHKRYTGHLYVAAATAHANRVRWRLDGESSSLAGRGFIRLSRRPVDTAMAQSLWGAFDAN